MKQETGGALAPTTIYDVIAQMVRDPTVDADRLRQFMELQERAEARAAEAEFNRSMAACQEEIQPIWRNAKGENNRYAELEYIDIKIRPIIAKHGFALSFNSPEKDGQDVTAECILRHTAGHKEKYSLSAGLDVAGPKGNATKTPVQGLGSTMSYLRRYLIGMIFNLVFSKEDRDGAGAVINAAQRDQIFDMFTACSMDEASKSKFLEIVKVKTVGEIRVADFGNAMARLQEKLRKVQQG